MRLLLIVILTAAFVFDCTAAPDPRATAIDWSSKDIRVIGAGDDVRIVLHTAGTMGRRLIQVGVEAFGDDSYATLTYQVIQNFAESYKSMEPYDVTWTMPKGEFDRLRSKRKFYVLRRDDAILKAAEVAEIKTNWKVE